MSRVMTDLSRRILIEPVPSVDEEEEEGGSMFMWQERAERKITIVESLAIVFMF
jgi:hypothetical protein